ncbi:hypothetical protein APHAL10511_004272 [Amanita phalloides]|nr:hypothetical protein APHAL10511_004272 [Amanita phalloides]
MTATVFKPIPLVLPPSDPPKPLTALDLSTSSISTTTEPSASRALQRLRSSLEQTLRTATRPRKASPLNDITTLTTSSNKGKEKAKPSEDASREKGKSKMLQHFPSKVPFRRGARDAVTPSPIHPSGSVLQEDEQRHDKSRVAGPTGFQTPSLRQASISSPALHLSSQAIPSPESRSAVPVFSTSSAALLVSPLREQSKKVVTPSSHREISSPLRLGSRRDKADPVDPFTEGTSSRHKAIKANPSIIPSSPSSPSLPSKVASSRGRVPASRLDRDLPSPPETPPPSVTRARGPSKTATSLSNPSMSASPSPEPPTPTRGASPITARSPTMRARAIASPTRLLPTNPSPTPPKNYMEQAQRTSLDAPRCTSLEAQRRPAESPLELRTDSPSPVRRRATSPTQPSYAQNRHFRIVSGSLEDRELIRTATSMLCKEMIRPPPHMSRTGIRDWEEVERRLSSLARLERVWGKSGSSSSSFLSTSGEERELKHFAEALKDGFVLCQFINKLRSTSVVRPDPREDGVYRSSNITKFLAACASYGLPSEELFQPGDLTAVASEQLARVARTIISLINFVDSPLPSKIISGQGKKSVPVPMPYQNSASRGSASTPNLLHSSHSPPSSPTRRRWPPPSALPPVRSSSSEEDSNDGGPKRKDFDNSPDELEEEGLIAVYASTNSSSVPRIMPPPRSALRPRPMRQAQNSGASSGAADIHLDETQNSRQSVASSAMTDTTVTTMLSSILDNSRSWSGQNKFGTIRTVTTEMTSEAPSLSRTEGSSIADDMALRKSQDGGSKFRDRKLSETPPADLTRVAEETDESVSSKGDGNQVTGGKIGVPLPKTEKILAIHLHKGRWPDDFMNVFGNGRTPPSTVGTPPLELDEEILFSSSPPRDSPLPARTRREVPPDPPGKTHHTRHSVDNPMIMQRGTLLRKETSPDSFPQPRLMLRRHSTKPSVAHRNAIYLPRTTLDDPVDPNNDSAVPFPQARSRGSTSGRVTPLGGSRSNHERPKFPRGRFQSDIEESLTARRRMHTSADESAGRARSRIESTVSLGVSSNASASDLLRRESVDGNRKTIIVKEDGRPPVQYQLGNCIGRGQFGSVYRALNLSTGQMVAVKQIRLEGLKEAEVAELMREVNIYRSLSHPGIVRYEGMARDKETLSIVLEYAENGSLGQTLKAFGRLNERLVASYVVKILEGLHYLHGQDVVHCDLKAANILTTKTGNVKLTDFGVSLNLRAMGRDQENVAGTPHWMAPEIIELKGASSKSDIWSLACTVIELLTGKPPYADISNSMSVMFHIVDDVMPPIPEECSDLAREFLTQCFNKEPTKRPSAEILFEHPWLKQNWGLHKELRPQDSIPFLRRVSADLQKSEVVRYLTQIEMPDASAQDNVPRPPKESSSHQSLLEQRLSTCSPNPLGESDFSPREHSFVKTTFSKPMRCRVCLSDVKKSAVICAQCSLISHSKCAHNAPPTCDLRAQLLLYAQYAEKGNPNSLYHNPADGLGSNRPPGASSDTPSVTQSDPSPSVNPAQPHTGFKFISVFKRSSRSHLEEHASSASVPQTLGDGKMVRKKTGFYIRNKERPRSTISNSTGVSSLRSAATAAGSLSSGPDVRKSRISNTSMDGGVHRYSDPGARSRMASAVDSVDGDEVGLLPSEIRQRKKRDSMKSNNGCIVQ